MGKSAVKSKMKNVDVAVASGGGEQGAAAYQVAIKAIDQGVSKGILHKKTAARKKGSATLKMNAMA